MAARRRKTNFERTERTFLKIILGIGGGLVLLILLGVGGFNLYQKWEQRHLVRVAVAYMSGGDLRASSLSAQRAFQIYPSADTARIIAQIAERSGDRSALGWRRKVLELEPQSKEDALSLVRTALRNNDLGTAEKTLAAFDDKAKQTADYHAASGRLAEMKKDLGTSEFHWEKAAEIAPNEPSYQFQLALVRLETGDPTKRESARAALERLKKDPKQRVAALRTLVADDAAHHEEPQKLRLLAEELQDCPEAAFNDRIIYLEILRQLHDPAFAEYLEKLKKEAPADPANLSSLVNWMSVNNMETAALEFTSRLPADSLEKWPVPPTICETYAKLKDWAGLETLAAKVQWKSHEYLGNAYLARALRGQSRDADAEKAWIIAQRQASNQPQSISNLARAVSAWGWQSEAADLLWSLTKFPETRIEALQALYQLYASRSDTSGLYRALLRMSLIAPDDITVKNNLAQISLLLGAEVARAQKMASEVYASDPSNPAFVSTYAFSLYTAGDVEAAIQVMDKLPANRLKEPSLAAYYGVFLAAVGRNEKASEFLQVGAKAMLLPEEEALVAKAKATIEQH